MASKSFEELAYIEYSKLVAENAKLREQIAQQQAGFKECIKEDIDIQVAQQKEINSLKETIAQLNLACDHYCETIAQQAEALRVKDEALKEIDLADDDRDFLRGNEVDLVAEALAIQPNPDILRERDAQLVERIATTTMDYYPEQDILLGIADQIRNGGWK